jgi:hypothetical protein
MFGLGALLSGSFATAFFTAWIWPFARRGNALDMAPMSAYVFPGSALLCIALAVFLTMLGLIAEEALQKVRAEEQLDRFGAREVHG